MEDTSNRKWYSGMFTLEDWWAIWLGLGLILITLFFFWSGHSIKSWAITPGSWSAFSDIVKDLASNYASWIILVLVFTFLFSLSIFIMGTKVSRFLPGFIALILGSLIIFYLSSSEFMKRMDIGAPLLALIVGLVISNLRKPPAWLQPA